MNKQSALMGLLVAGLATSVPAQQAGGFGMVALAAGQTAQVNVVNTGGHSIHLPCHVDIALTDYRGDPISESESSNFALTPGNVASTAISHPNLRPGERFHVRVNVRKLESKADGRNECAGLRAIVEVFDTDAGTTTVFGELSIR